MSDIQPLTLRTAAPGVVARINCHTNAAGEFRYAAIELIKGQWPKGKQLGLIVMHADRQFRLEPNAGRDGGLWVDSTLINLADEKQAKRARKWFQDLPERLQHVYRIEEAGAAA